MKAGSPKETPARADAARTGRTVPGALYGVHGLERMVKTEGVRTLRRG